MKNKNNSYTNKKYKIYNKNNIKNTGNDINTNNIAKPINIEITIFALDICLDKITSISLFSNNLLI